MTTEPTTEELAGRYTIRHEKWLSGYILRDGGVYAILWPSEMTINERPMLATSREICAALNAARLLCALEAIEVCRSQSAEYDQQTGLPLTGDQQ